MYTNIQLTISQKNSPGIYKMKMHSRYLTYLVESLGNFAFNLVVKLPDELGYVFLNLRL
jgi:hypothetical protein